MKNILYTLLILGSFSLGCKKDDTVTPSEPTDSDKQDVFFSVSKLIQTVEPFSKTGADISAIGDTLSNYAKYLYCYTATVNGLGPNIMTVQTVDSIGFGTIKLKLTKGKYKVAFFASNQRINLFHSRRFDQLSLQGREGSYWNDLFMLFQDIEVGDTTLNKEIRLKRWTGAVQVNLEDAIPASAAKITFEVTNDAIAYSFTDRASSDVTSTKEFILTENQKGKTNQKFLMHVLSLAGGDFPQVLTIRGYDNENNIIAEKTLPEFRGFSNTLTQFTGNLFSTSSSVSKSFVTVNPTWDAGGTNIKF